MQIKVLYFKPRPRARPAASGVATSPSLTLSHVAHSHHLPGAGKAPGKQPHAPHPARLTVRCSKRGSRDTPVPSALKEQVLAACPEYSHANSPRGIHPPPPPPPPNPGRAQPGPPHAQESGSSTGKGAGPRFAHGRPAGAPPPTVSWRRRARSTLIDFLCPEQTTKCKIYTVWGSTAQRMPAG